MFRHPRRFLILIIVLTLLAVYVDLPKFSFQGASYSHPKIDTPYIKRDLEPKLGLDLAGGVHLVMSAEMSGVEEQDRDSALESAKNIIENRINSLGVTEPLIQASKTQGQYRLIIELAGISDIDQAVSTVRKTAHLEFKKLKADAPPEATFAAKPQDFESTGLTGTDLKRAVAQPSQDTQVPGYVIGLEFNEAGKKKFEDITRQELSRPLAIFLDEELISAPVVQAIISEGNAQITGNFTGQEARQLAIELNAGALPIPLKIESQNRVGPTLGQDSIQKSLVAA